MILTEISRKFQVDEMAANCARFGLETARVFTDPAKAFARAPAPHAGPARGDGRARAVGGHAPRGGARADARADRAARRRAAHGASTARS